LLTLGLLACRDEYEVARLFSDGRFLAQLQAQFDGDYWLRFHLAPSWLAKPDPITGAPRKREFGPWMLRTFGLWAKLRFLRGTPLDPFASEERRLERALIGEYERDLELLRARATPATSSPPWPWPGGRSRCAATAT
jgi:indolepyruvate ferredoxin oxidoreductase